VDVCLLVRVDFLGGGVIKALKKHTHSHSRPLLFTWRAGLAQAVLGQAEAIADTDGARVRGLLREGRAGGAGGGAGGAHGIAAIPSGAD
jgi:hypothetical protein